MNEKSKNSSAGFMGAVGSLTEMERKNRQKTQWETVSDILNSMSGTTPKQTRIFLDSKYGRHFGEYYSDAYFGLEKSPKDAFNIALKMFSKDTEKFLKLYNEASE